MHFLNHAAQREQAEYIRDDHHGIEAVGHIPYKVNLSKRTEYDAGRHEQRIHFHGFGAKQVFDVRLAEEIPSHDRRECKEEHAHCDEDIPSLAE